MRGILFGMLSLVWGWAGAQVGAGYFLVPAGAEPVAVSTHRVTTLIFPMAVRAGVRVTKDVQVEKVRGVENVLAIRAAKVGFAVTNLAVFGMDGREYSFTLFYSDTAAAWQYKVMASGDSGRGLILTGLPADENRLGEDARRMESRSGRRVAAVCEDKMRLAVTGIYYTDSLIWVAGRIRNRGVPDFSVGRVRLYTQERKRVKRTAIQESDIEPVFSDVNASVIPGGNSRTFALGYRGMAVPDGKRLVLEVGDTEGLQVLRVRIRPRQISEAKRP